MEQKELLLPNDVQFADLCFRFNSDTVTYTMDLGPMLHFCAFNGINASSVIPCSLEASNPGLPAIVERSAARLEVLLHNWYTLHCARSGVRDFSYEGWLRRGERRKRISQH